MRSYSAKEIIRILEEDGWFHVKTVGDHYGMKHPTKSGKVTIPHPNKDLPTGTVKSIAKQAGIVLD